MMKPNLHFGMIRAAVGCALAVLAAAGCGGTKSNPSVGMGTVPEMPKLILGTATVSGVVRDGAGGPIAGATVKVAETGASTMTDPSGAYMLEVPSDSTITLAISAMGFATSYRESVLLADHATATGNDVMMLTLDEVMRFTAMGFPAEVATRGLMAVRLHSVSPSCMTAGARISVWPPLGAKVVYAQPSATGGLDEPDPTLTAVQDGTRVSAWLSGTISPGAMLTINLEQTGCTVMLQNPSSNGLVFTGQRRVDAQSLTEAEIFLQ
jgi:hypothetical protein